MPTAQTGSIAAMIQAARAIDKANTGYDQNQRWGFFDRSALAIRPNAEGDCSSVCGAIARLGGFSVDLSDPFWTGNFRQRLVAAGFTAIRFAHLGQLRPGDFVLNTLHHVEFVIAPGRMFSANKDERGRFRGGYSGDQTGGEVYEKAAYVYGRGWDWILRPPAAAWPGLPTAPAPTATISAHPVLRRGSRGDAVRTLQRALAHHGHNLAIDGDFGPATEKAVRALQRAHNLSVDGIVGPQTWTALNSAPRQATPAARPVLRRGSRGDAVRTLQRALVAAGYRLAVDGQFGPATQNALRRFQVKLGLVADAVAGPQTYGALSRLGYL